MQEILQTLGEIIKSTTTPYQIVALFILCVAVLAYVLIQRSGLIEVLKLTGRKGPRSTFVILVVSITFLVLALFALVSFSLIQFLQIDLVRIFGISRPNISSSRPSKPIAPEQLSQLMAEAKNQFEERRYQETAEVFRRITEALDKGNPSLGEYEGMVTASLFGAGRHEEGLQYLCSLYQGRPLSDHRHRHRAHAHIRVFAYKQGFSATEAMLRRVRSAQGCNRDDFTQVFAAIPLEIMRLAEKGFTPVGTLAKDSLRDLDTAYLIRLTRDAPSLPFIDHAHFALGHYQVVYRQFPRSYLRDLALLASAEVAERGKQKELFQEFLAVYSKSRRAVFALKHLVRIHAQDGDFTQAANYIAHYPELFSGDDDYDPSFHIRFWFREQCEAITSSFSTANFSTIFQIYSDAHSKLQAAYGAAYKISTSVPVLAWEQRNCFGYKEISASQIQSVIELAGNVVNSQKTRNLAELFRLGLLLKQCGDRRQNPDSESLGQSPRSAEARDARCDSMLAAIPEAASFHKAATRVLAGVARDSTTDTRASSALFLAGLAARRNRDFGEYEALMREYIFRLPQGPFADDAYTELGWYYAVIAKDYVRAEAMWRNVEANYPGRNAYDNALNWLVILYRNQGRYDEALRYSVKLVSFLASDRIRKRIKDRERAIEAARLQVKIGEHARIRLVVDWSDYTIWGGSDDGTHLRVWHVSDDSGQLTDLRGKIIESIDDQRVVTLEQAFQLLRGRRSAGVRNVTVTAHDKWYETESYEVPISYFGL
jgi:tetratricopeptide (TPR) repeat protein